MYILRRHTLFAALLLPMVGTAAIEGHDSPWSFNGYGSLGIAHSDEDRADYQPDLRVPEGPGRSGAWDYEMDSRVAAQVGFDPAPSISTVAQVVAEKGVDGDFEPRLEWANVQYSPSRSWQIRGGRIALDAFLVSDYRKVGFAIPWVRPPAEVYRLVPITQSDGIDVTYRFNRGEAAYQTHIFLGGSESGMAEGEGWGVAHSLAWRGAMLHLSYLDADIELDGADELFDAIEAFGPEGRAVSRRYDPSRRPIRFASAGLSYDPGGWFAMSEWAMIESDSIIGDHRAWYLSAGYRLGGVTPYATYATGDRVTSSDVQGLTVAAYPPALAAAAAGLNAVLEEAARSGDQDSVSLGVRWDLSPSMAVKAQWDRIDVAEGAIGTFTNLEPGFQPRRVNAVSFSFDFLF